MGGSFLTSPDLGECRSTLVVDLPSPVDREARATAWPPATVVMKSVGASTLRMALFPRSAK